MVSCLRFIWITNSSDHRRVWIFFRSKLFLSLKTFVQNLARISTQYITLNVKLSNSQLNKLKSGIKNNTEVTCRN